MVVVERVGALQSILAGGRCRWRHLSPHHSDNPRVTAFGEQLNPSGGRSRGPAVAVHPSSEPDHSASGDFPAQCIGDVLRRSSGDLVAGVSQERHHLRHRHGPASANLGQQHEPQTPTPQWSNVLYPLERFHTLTVLRSSDSEPSPTTPPEAGPPRPISPHHSDNR